MSLVPVIGIEVHTELKTNAKAFSDSANSFKALPNTKVNVLDLGYPGTLPKLNKEVINKGIALALALNCQISKNMHFDRKNYFYPDLPKGYQITQKKTPIGIGGYLEITVADQVKRIEIEEIHLEEDTCKSIHENGKTYLNYNRAGVPLIEIVTKPCITSGKEASLYVESLREILQYLDISDGKIEEGSMRCDANVSLKEASSNILGTKTEIKNIGSISNVNEAINYEIKRQTALINSGEAIVEETRRYDEKKQETVLMRLKETGNDYRYFPDADLPSVLLTDEWINEIKESLPVLPSVLRNKYNSLGLNDISIKAIINNLELCHFYEQTLILETNPVTSANLLTGDILAYLNKNNLSITSTKITPVHLKDLVTSLNDGTISSKIAKDLIISILEKGTAVKELLSNTSQQISDKEELTKIINAILEGNPNIQSDDNKNRAMKYLMGLIMKETKGLANPVITNELVTSILNC